MGLTPIIWTSSGDTDFDTDDWKIPANQANGTSSFASWQQIVSLANNLTTGFITLEHDLYQQTVDMAVGYILPSALTTDPPFTLQSVIECLHQPRSNSYAELIVKNSTTSTNSTSTTLSGSGNSSSSGETSNKAGSATSKLSAVTSLGNAVGAAVALSAWSWL